MKPAILLADDSPTIQRLVERSFEGTRFTVVSVSNGDAAVRKLEEIRPVAVLADVYMPGKTGYEVCTFVKAHPTLSGTPVVLLVGAFEAFDEGEANRVGADGRVTKPFESRQLTDIVTGLVGDSVPDAAPAAPETQVAGRESEAAVGEQDTHAAVLPEEVEAVPEVDAVPERLRSGHTAEPREEAPALPASDDPAAPNAPAGAADAPAEALDDGDLLGLRDLFPPTPVEPARQALSEAEVDAIADRVIERLSAEIIESIAWDIVPEIADRVMKDGLKNG